MKSLSARWIPAVLPFCASASISFDLQVEQITTVGGDPLPAAALVALVVDTAGDGFGDPLPLRLPAPSRNALETPTFLNGADDLVVWVGDGTVNGIAGITVAAPFDLMLGSYGGQSWQTGDRIALYWFPTLTADSVELGSSVSYGRYAPLETSWTTPADGSSSHPLYAFSTTATILARGDLDAGLLTALFRIPGDGGLQEVFPVFRRDDESVGGLWTLGFPIDGQLEMPILWESLDLEDWSESTIPPPGDAEDGYWWWSLPTPTNGMPRFYRFSRAGR